MGQRPTATAPCVLLVESSAIIGLDLADDLEGQGYDIAGPFACAAGLHWLKTSTPDIAVLDVDLQSGACVGLVRELRARRVPVLVYSAHRQGDALAEFRSLPWLPMPAPREALRSALRALSAPVPA